MAQLGCQEIPGKVENRSCHQNNKIPLYPQGDITPGGDFQPLSCR